MRPQRKCALKANRGIVECGNVYRWVPNPLPEEAAPAGAAQPAAELAAAKPDLAEEAATSDSSK